jgi:hypothetical protein
LVSALDWGSRGRRFESARPDEVTAGQEVRGEIAPIPLRLRATYVPQRARRKALVRGEDEERPLFEQYRDLIDQLPIDPQGDVPADLLRALDEEIQAILTRLLPYLESVRKLEAARGYHVLISTESRFSERAKEELKRFDASGRYREALTEVVNFQAEDWVTDELDRLRFLLALREGRSAAGFRFDE